MSSVFNSNIINHRYKPHEQMIFGVLKNWDPKTKTFFFFVVNFVIHWNKTAMGLHVFPIPIPPPTSLSTRSP